MWSIRKKKNYVKLCVSIDFMFHNTTYALIFSLYGLQILRHFLTGNFGCKEIKRKLMMLSDAWIALINNLIVVTFIFYSFNLF
jgi:hypothetical protein